MKLTIFESSINIIQTSSDVLRQNIKTRVFKMFLKKLINFTTEVPNSRNVEVQNYQQKGKR